MEKKPLRTFIRQFKRGEEGEIAVFLACYMVILILCLALTADLGNTYLTHLRMRNAVDLAATSIGVQLPSSYSAEKMAALQSTAETIVRQNGIDLSDVTMTCEILQDNGQIYAARVILQNEVTHYFAQLYLNRFSTIRVGDLVYVTQDAANAAGYKITVVDS